MMLYKCQSRVLLRPTGPVNSISLASIVADMPAVSWSAYMRLVKLLLVILGMNILRTDFVHSALTR